MKISGCKLLVRYVFVLINLSCFCTFTVLICPHVAIVFVNRSFVVRALMICHHRGVLHCAVKLANVLIGEGLLKLSDYVWQFGLKKMA